jgi:hypothetical protein
MHPSQMGLSSSLSRTQAAGKDQVWAMMEAHIDGREPIKHAYHVKFVQCNAIFGALPHA